MRGHKTLHDTFMSMKVAPYLSSVAPVAMPRSDNSAAEGGLVQSSSNLAIKPTSFNRN